VHTENPGPVSLELHAIRDALAADVPLIVGGAGAMTISAELKRPGLILCDSMAEMRAVLARDPVVTRAPAL
jgi:hypothetical protein